jgi:zinc transport system ATP-binding protein
LKPSKGKIFLFGQEIRVFKDWPKIGYVPQKAGSLTVRFPITVEEVVKMGRGDREAMTRALRAVDITGIRKKLLTELSGGQQQRVFIARALVSDPELLILDEPTVGVDLNSQTKFYRLLRDLNSKQKLTLILVSHDIEVVAHEVNTVACLNQTLICHGRPKEVLRGNFLEKIYGRDIRRLIHAH